MSLPECQKLVQEYWAISEQTEKLEKELQEKRQVQFDLKQNITARFMKACTNSTQDGVSVVLKPDGKTPLTLVLSIEELDSGDFACAVEWPVKCLEDGKLHIEFDQQILRKLQKEIYFCNEQELELARHWQLSPDERSDKDKVDTNVVIGNNFSEVALRFYESL